MLTFNLKYFLLAVALFIIEVVIALYVRDALIRPYGGDYLVVMLVYCGIRTFVNAEPWKVAFGSLIFAYLIEAMQYFNIVDRLGLTHNKLARTVIGYGFEWKDILAYTLGIVTVFFIEYCQQPDTRKKNVV